MRVAKPTTPAPGCFSCFTMRAKPKEREALWDAVKLGSSGVIYIYMYVFTCIYYLHTHTYTCTYTYVLKTEPAIIIMFESSLKACA